MARVGRGWERSRRARAPGGPEALYGGKSFRFIAVVDDLAHGRSLAATLDMPQQSAGVFFLADRKVKTQPLPERLVLLYPEHELTARQQALLVRRIVELTPQVREVTIITTSAAILGDAREVEQLCRDDE